VPAGGSHDALPTASQGIFTFSLNRPYAFSQAIPSLSRSSPRLYDIAIP
jgi:hypothetical protein